MGTAKDLNSKICNCWTVDKGHEKTQWRLRELVHHSNKSRDRFGRDAAWLLMIGSQRGSSLMMPWFLRHRLTLAASSNQLWRLWHSVVETGGVPLMEYMKALRWSPELRTPGNFPLRLCWLRLCQRFLVSLRSDDTAQQMFFKPVSPFRR